MAHRFLIGILAPILLSGAAAGEPAYTGFGAPIPVTIRDYDGDAMEPFVSRDGHYLFFNNRNDPGTDTNLHWSERVDDQTFAYRGEIEGANSMALDGVASMDSGGDFYFVSTRSYSSSLSTIYRGQFAAGTLSSVAIVDGISPHKPGIVNFDAEISGDGQTLIFVDGRFSGGAVPDAADLVIAERVGTGFRRLPSSSALLAAVNTDALEYAPAVSADLCELFFTRMQRGWKAPVIYRAARPSSSVPFGAPERVAAITGFVEAPALSADGRSLYFHRLDGGRFRIYRVTRDLPK